MPGNKSKHNNSMRDVLESMALSIHVADPPKISKVAIYIFCAFISIFVLAMFLPWKQFSSGYGYVTNLNPNDRMQYITANVSGTVKWHVVDGTDVKKNDIIAEVIDNDENIIHNINQENSAIQKQYEAATQIAKTAKINYLRQKELYEMGISSRRDYEKADMEYKKSLSESKYYQANLAQSNVKLARQKRQLIRAPSNGTVIQAMSVSEATIVKPGDVIANFVPDTHKFIAEVFIEANDAPLVHPGRKVKLQFEGWPAVQIIGWPSIAIGTFDGIVTFVDLASQKDGSYRILIEPYPDEKHWPSSLFLRRGARVNAWILLDRVSLGFEIWRKFNGFPLSVNYIKNLDPYFIKSYSHIKNKDLEHEDKKN